VDVIDIGARFVLRPGSWDTVDIGILLLVESDFMVSIPLLMGYNASSVDKNKRSHPNSWTIRGMATKSSGSGSLEGWVKVGYISKVWREVTSKEAVASP
jgi:hypothetical protein